MKLLKKIYHMLFNFNGKDEEEFWSGIGGPR